MQSFAKKVFVRFWPIIVLLCVWGIFSSPYVVKGLVPFPSKYLVTFFPPWSPYFSMPVKNSAMPDVITQIFPWKKLTIETWKTGSVPLWNPYSFSGTPHVGTYQTAVFSPLNLLYLVLPQIDAWSMVVLLQPLLAGLFMYLFIRSLLRSKAASIIGSLAFSWCGFLVTWMAYGTLGHAALFLPLILYAVHGYFEKPSWRYGVLGSVGIALSFVSGHFQISVYVLLCAFLYTVFETWTRNDWRKGMILGVYIFLGIGLSLPQLLPSFDAYQASVRSESFVKGEIIPWRYLITLVAPDFFGNPVTRNDWFGHYAEWAGFIGVAPLLLALFSVVGKKTKQEWFFLTVGLVSLALALPTPLSDLLFALRIPVLSTSAASRIIILASFSLSVLSGFGLDGLVSDWKSGKKKKTLWIATGSIVCVVSIWFLLVLRLMDPQQLAIARRNFIMPSALVAATAFLFLAGFVKKRFFTGYILVAFILLSGFDLLRFASKWMPFEPREYIYPNLKVIDFLKKEIGYNRVYGNIGSEMGVYFGLPLIEGYDAVYRSRYGEFIGAAADGMIKPGQRSVVLLDKAGKYSEDVLELLGVRYVVQRKSDGRSVWTYPFWQYAHYQQVFSDEQYEVYANTASYPRVFLASSYVVKTDPQKIIDELFSSSTNRMETLVLEEKPTEEPAAGEGEAIITGYAATRVDIAVSTSVPKLLFLSDVFDPGWSAYVDGVSTHVYRADYDFRAVGVGAGAHTVRFVYEPESVLWGIRIAIGVALVLVGIGVRGYLYENRVL